MRHLRPFLEERRRDKIAQLRQIQLLEFLGAAKTEGNAPPYQPTFFELFYAPPPDPRGAEGVKRDMLAKLNGKEQTE